MTWWSTQILGGRALREEKGKNAIYIEKDYSFKESLSAVRLYASAQNILHGIIGGFVISLVTVPLIITAGEMSGLDKAGTSSWVFSVYFFGGLLGILLAFKYQQPIAGAWSIPGVFVVSEAMQYVTINEAIFAFLLSGLFVFLLGYSGIVRKAVSLIPLPVMMAMIAGVLLRFGLAIIGSFQTMPLVAVFGVIGFFVSKCVLPKMPSVLGTLIFGGIAAVLMGNTNFNSFNFGLVELVFYVPHFNILSILSITVPLSILVIGAENMQAIGVLKSEGYRPPINAMAIWSGIGGMFAPWLGGHNANIAGPMTAFMAGPDAGPKEGRFISAISADVVFIFFGIFAITSVSLIEALPKALVDLLVGLVMMSVIIKAFIGAWSDEKFGMGAFVSLIIAISGISIFQIGAPFWALIFGTLTALIFESEHYKREIEKNKTKEISI